MTDRPVPHDLDAEEALVGAMWIATQQTRGLVIDAITPSDLYGDTWRDLFMAITVMHRRGDAMDPYALADDLRRTGADPALARNIVTTKGMPSSIPAYVDIITRLAVSRAVQKASLEVAEVAKVGATAPAELVELARDAIAAIDVPADGAVTGLSTMDDFLDTADLTPSPWVIPGLLRAGWRCLLVAPEGVGKSTLARAIALAASAGVHPLTHTPIAPVRTLLIDLENPDDAIAETAAPMRTLAAQVKGRDPNRAWLWRRPEGIDLRARADRASFHAVLAQVQPDLVCLGPLYKAYRPQPRENDESAAADVQAILDDARVRFGFSLLMEHHAPKATGMSNRDLVPYGSSLWMRWPELGLKLIPCEDDGPPGSLHVGRFRLDRMLNAWPARLDRGGAGAWPWAGYWPKGMAA